MLSLVVWMMILLQVCVLTGCASGKGSKQEGENAEKEGVESGIAEEAGTEKTNVKEEGAEKTSEEKEGAEKTSEEKEGAEKTSEEKEGAEKTSLEEESSEKTSREQKDGKSEESGDVLRAQVLKVGKADAIVLFCGDETMVIDCGEEDDGQEILDYLQEEGVSEIDVLVITHFDKDHVGGADAVLEGMPVGRVLLPAYAGSGTEYEDFMSVLEKTDAEPENVQEPVRFQLGAASVLVEPPISYEIPTDAANDDAEYDNNFSLITTVEFCDQRMVFAGDIEKQRIREWLAQGGQEPCAVLKVPHHGVYNKALEDLFKTLQPAYAIICDSKKNPADDRTLELLRQCGAECLETKDGDISILCDSEGIEVRQ